MAYTVPWHKFALLRMRAIISQTKNRGGSYWVESAKFGCNKIKTGSTMQQRLVRIGLQLCISLIWFPGNRSIEGNERVHELARCASLLNEIDFELVFFIQGGQKLEEFK